MSDTLYFTGQVNDSLTFTGDGTSSQLIATGSVAVAGPTGAIGPQGATGATGATGAAGANGTDGATLRNGAGAPSNALGNNGDYYLNNTNDDMYYKSGGTYSVVANFRGATGTTGSTGATGATGAAGTNGATGATGPTGATGAAGTNGATWYNGSTVPSSGSGVNGDYYLRTTNGDVYFKATGTWSVIENITGPAGPGGTATLLVAASTASAKIKAIADYAATGTGDQVTIQSAVDAIIVLGGGTVILSGGTFNLASGISWAAHNVVLRGQGRGATILSNSTGVANFTMVKIGNRQVDGIMRNFNGLAEMTITHAGGASTNSCLWVDGGGRGSYVYNVQTNEAGVPMRFTDLDRYNITGIDVNNPRSTGVLYEVGAEGTFGKVSMRDSSMNLSDASSVCLKLDTLTGTNPFDSLVFENNLFYATSGVTGTIGVQVNLAAIDTIFTGGQFENPMSSHVEVNSTSDSRLSFKSVSFIQNNATATTNAFKLSSGNHAITIDTCNFQKLTNVFNGVSGFSNLEFIGWTKNNGNITNLFTGSFGLRHGTDTAFVGNGALYLGTDNERYENVFTNQLRIHNSSPAPGKFWGATDTDGNGSWSTPGTGISRVVTTSSGSFTAGSTGSTDYVYLLAGAHVPTMPTAVGNTNRYTFKNNHSASITFLTTSAQTIEGGTLVLGPGESVDLTSDNANWYVI